MSSYRRDDKVFRAQIARLADSGLTLDCSQLHGNTRATMERCGYTFKPQMPQRHKLAEFIGGIVGWIMIGAGLLIVGWAGAYILSALSSLL